MSIFRSSRTWWALSSTRARLTSVGAAALVLGLAGTSVAVWTSPANPVARVVQAVTAQDRADAKLIAERNSLLSQVVALQKQLDGSASRLSLSAAKVSDLQQQLWTAQGKLEAASAASAAHQSSVASPKPTKAATPPLRIAAPSKAAIIAPAGQYFGLMTEQAPFNFASYDAAAAKVGFRPNVVGYFGGWDQNYRGDVVANSWKRGTLPVLTWESRPIGSGNDVTVEPDYTLPAIIGDPANGVPGRYDDYLRQYARAIVATGLPLGIRLDHEMNGTWYPWAETDDNGNPVNSNRRGDYVKMWQHVHDIFQQEGANNLVVWIWAPNIINKLSSSHRASAYLDSLYPGDAYVDVVGLSGYLRPSYQADNDFSFAYTYNPTLAELRRITSKPIFLAEVGASEVGGHKAAWVTSFFQALAKPENSDIIGFDWFDMAVTSYTGGELSTNDWRIDSRQNTLDAFKAGLVIPGSRFHLTPI